ncbi:MAG: hypothetical protein ACLPLR_13760 [Terriglobales bacterium]
MAELSSACEWTACTVPITHTSKAASTHTALTHPPRFAGILSIAIPTSLVQRV